MTDKATNQTAEAMKPCRFCRSTDLLRSGHPHTIYCTGCGATINENVWQRPQQEAIPQEVINKAVAALVLGLSCEDKKLTKNVQQYMSEALAALQSYQKN